MSIALSCILICVLKCNAQNTDTAYIKPADLTGNTKDNSFAIKKLLDNARYSVIVLPPGKYTVSGIDIRRPVKILGQKTILIATENALPAFINVYSGNVALEGIKIDGDNKVRKGIFISVKIDNVVIKNLELCNIRGDKNNSANGIWIDDYSKNIKIVNSAIHDISGPGNGIMGDTIGANRGIHIKRAENCIIDNCVFDNIYDFEDGDAIMVFAFFNKQKSTWYNSDVKITNCHFYNVRGRAIKIQASSCTIDNNYIESKFSKPGEKAKSGIAVFGENNIVTNNVIKLGAAAAGIEVIGGMRNQFTKNQISLGEGDGNQKAMLAKAGNRSGFMFNGTDNNIVTDNKITGAKVGIFSIGKANGLTIQNNQFLSCEVVLSIVNGNKLQILKNELEGTTTNTGLILSNCKDVSIEGNSFGEMQQPIRISNSPSININRIQNANKWNGANKKRILVN